MTAPCEVRSSTDDPLPRHASSSDPLAAVEITRRRAPIGFGWPWPRAAERVQKVATTRSVVRGPGAIAIPCQGGLMAITMHHRGCKSELRCARRMRLIEQGRFPLNDAWYTALEVADRYEVHVQSVYDGIRFGHALYPVADAKGDGPRPRRQFSLEAIEACDRARLLFYKTTPSWHEMTGSDASRAPPRRSAAAVIAEDERLKRNG